MVVKSTRSAVKDGFGILRSDGIIAALHAALRFANLNPEGYLYYLWYLYKRDFTSQEMSDQPFRIVTIDPSLIERSVFEHIDRWKHLGEIRPGNWDLQCRDLNDVPKYRSVIEHFDNGTPWEDTEIYKLAAQRIEAGNSAWNGCTTFGDLDERIKSIENLYQSLQEYKYKSQEQIHGRSYRSIVLDRKFDRSMEEIAVAIGRSGELLLVDGNHRLAIAHILDLDEISVHVIVRHKQRIVSQNGPNRSE